MNKGIGEMIIRLREGKGYTQEQLCKGICSVAELARIENNQIIPGHFRLDFIFGRLGKSADKLEYVLKKEIYILYELRYQIQTHILHQEFMEAEQLLMEYEVQKQKDKAFHRQFVAQERAQIAWMRGEETEKVLRYVNQAIEETMPDINVLSSGMALSAEELKLLLFRWEVCKGTEYERPLREVRNILNYSEKYCTDLEELVNVYPYAVLLLTMETNLANEYEFMIYILDKAFELLRDTGRILYLPEIMEQYIRRLEYRKKDERTETLRRERNTLLFLEMKFDVYFEKYRLFQSMNREFDLDYEVIRKSREVAGKSQEEVAEDICTRETLSRIERGKNSPTDKTFEKLTERLERNRSRVDTVITTEEFEVIELKYEIIKNSHRLEYLKVKELLGELEKRVNCQTVENRQFILAEKIRKEIEEEKLSLEEGIKKLFDILALTVDWGKKNLFENRLTATEINILNQIASLKYDCKKKKDAIQIYENILNNYEDSYVNPVFHMRERMLIMGNLTSFLEETENLVEAIALGKRRISIYMEYGRITGLGRTLTTLACVAERKRNVKCKETFLMALDMLDLMKEDYRYKLVKEYIDNSNFVQYKNID